MNDYFAMSKKSLILDIIGLLNDFDAGFLEGLYAVLERSECRSTPKIVRLHGSNEPSLCGGAHNDETTQQHHRAARAHAVRTRTPARYGPLGAASDDAGGERQPSVLC